MIDPAAGPPGAPPGAMPQPQAPPQPAPDPAPIPPLPDQLAAELDPEAIYEEFKIRVRESDRHQKDWRTEARTLYDLLAGRQWDPDDEAALKEKQRPIVTFNIIAKFMDAVQGLQINNRQDIRYYPRTGGKSQLNEELTGAVGFARDVSNMADEESDAFCDSILTGMGWMEGFIDDNGDPPGLPAGQRIDPLQMRWDPRARKKNLTDARYVVRMTRVTASEYRRITGEEPDASLERDVLEMGDQDEFDVALLSIPTPHDYPSGPGNAGGNAPTGPTYGVAEYQFWKYQTVQEVSAQGLGDRTMSTREWEAIQPVLQSQGIAHRATPREVRTFYRAYCTASGCKRLTRSPYQSGFTFHPITGKRDRNKNLWFGLGRAMIDPQKWTNKFFSSILWTVTSGSKGGLMAEADAFEDQTKAEASWSKPDEITITAPGALANGKVRDKPPAAYPDGMDRLMQFTMASLPAITGLNLELLGLADRDQPGVLEAHRKQSAMAIIAWAFDALRRYYRSMGKQLARYIIDYVPDDTLIRVTTEDGEQYIPLSKQRLALPFDVIVDEAPTSVNMQERVWSVLQTLMPMLLQARLPVPVDVLDYAPIPQDLAQKWKQTVAPDPKAQADQQQKAQQQFEATLRKILAEAADREADAGLKQAQTAEITHTLPATAASAHAEALTAAANAGAAQAAPPGA